MIFTRTCDNTRKMALMLRNLGFDAIPIHGQMAQAKRIGALNKFKAGERSILCATGGVLTYFVYDTQLSPCRLCKRQLQQQRNARKDRKEHALEISERAVSLWKSGNVTSWHLASWCQGSA